MDIQVYNFKDAAIRVVTKDDGPWFVASDVAKVLSLGRTHDMVRGLDPDEKGADTIRTPGGDQEVAIINEAGLYACILKSRKPEAKAFKRWVTHEVLPAIRRHGMYATEAVVERMLQDPDTMIHTLQALKAEREARKALEAEAAVNRPKVIFADAVSASKTDILVGDLAKLLRGNGVHVGANRMFAWLRGNGFLINRKGTDWNMPTQRAMELGLFKVKETAFQHPDGHVSLSKTPKVTGKGQLYFVERFLSGRFTIDQCVQPELELEAV